MKWHMTDKWTQHLPPEAVKEFRESVGGQWANITCAYNAEDDGRFISSGSWGGHNVLLPVVAGVVGGQQLGEGAFTIYYIDNNTIEVSYRIFPNKIRYQREVSIPH